MRDIVIIGAGGLGQEILWCINDINQDKKTYNVVGFVSEVPDEWGTKFHGYDVIRPDRVKVKDAAMGFANPQGKRKFVQKYRFNYPNLIHPDAKLTMKNIISPDGITLFAGVKLMPCSKIGNFVYLNVNVVIGHDTVIGNYCSMSPGALVMGNCVVGECTYIGVGASTREKVQIGKECVIGAGAAVVSKIPDYSLAVGVPAKVIKNLRA